MISKERIFEVMNSPKAGYPDLVKRLKNIGLSMYVFDIHKGEIVYHGHDGTLVKSTTGHYEINTHVSVSGFKRILKNNQDGKTDFPTFCKESADNGVASWLADLLNMVVTYYDLKNNLIYEEKIPIG